MIFNVFVKCLFCEFFSFLNLCTFFLPLHSVILLLYIR